MEIGLAMLCSGNIESALKHHFKNETIKSIDVGNFLVNFVLVHNTCFVLTPGLSKKPQTFQTEPEYSAIYNELRNRIPVDVNIVASIIGRGSAERHITTLYHPHKGKPQLFDSKLSSPMDFLTSSESAPSLRIMLSSLGRALFNWQYKKEVDLKDESTPLSQISYHGLGTQSLFDGISCGYHTLGTMINIQSLIAENKDVNRKNILSKQVQNPPVKQGLELLSNIEQAPQLNTLSFVKKAWNKSFNNPGGKRSFKHYFLGMPQEGESKLWWILAPSITLKNIIKCFFEFPLALTNSTFDALRTKLMQTSPTHWYTKIPRSLALVGMQVSYGLTEGVRRIVNFCFSPVEATYEALRVQRRPTNQHKKTISENDFEEDDFEIIDTPHETQDSHKKMSQYFGSPNMKKQNHTESNRAQNVKKSNIKNPRETPFDNNNNHEDEEINTSLSPG